MLTRRPTKKQFSPLETRFLRIVPVLSASMVVAIATQPSCAIEGDRAQSGCPVGDTCSPYTPDGLSLRGQSKADQLFNSTSPTADGGTQTFRIFDEFDGDALAFPFSVTATGCMDVAGIDGNEVTLAATDACSTLIELRDPVDNLLFDRFTLSSETAVQAFVVNTVADRFGNEAASDPLYQTDEVHPPFLNSADRKLGIGLLSREGTRVVDEGIDVAAMTAESAWDTFSGVIDDELLEVALSDRRLLAAPIRSVEFIDRIEEIIIDEEPDEDESRVHCFEGFNGNEAVLGVPFEFST